jgi:hypothetical protein
MEWSQQYIHTFKGKELKIQKKPGKEWDYKFAIKRD